MVGVTYGAPTEFRYGQRLNEDPRNWKPEELAGALDQDNLYVQMTFAGVMDRWVSRPPPSGSVKFAGIRNIASGTPISAPPGCCFEA